MKWRLGNRQHFIGFLVLLLVLGIASWRVLGADAGSRTEHQSLAIDLAPLDLADFSTVNLPEAHFGYSQFRANNNRSASINARSATWIVSNQGPRQNVYPFLVDESQPGVRIFGGTILGTVPLDRDWQDIYVNSAAVMVREAPRAEIYDWTINQAWDGIRIADGSDWFRIENVAVSDIRDDAVENDFGANGTIANSLFDGVFSGISMSHSQLPDLRLNVLTLDQVMLRMQAFPFRGQITHQSPFKIEALSPALKIHRSIIAIEDVEHIGRARLALAWDKTLEASENYLLNLSDRPFPKTYPLPAQGWTVLQGQAARDHWATARARWLRANPAPSGNQLRLRLLQMGQRVQPAE